MTYTWTFCSCTVADGFWGVIKDESAITVATVKATVVKKPNTFCTRTRAECMVGEQVNVERGCRKERECEYESKLWRSRACGARDETNTPRFPDQLQPYRRLGDDLNTSPSYHKLNPQLPILAARSLCHYNRKSG